MKRKAQNGSIALFYFIKNKNVSFLLEMRNFSCSNNWLVFVSIAHRDQQQRGVLQHTARWQ